MIKVMCRSCLRLFDADRVHERCSCPFCGGALAGR
jgi:hypothetical protein